MNFCFEFLNLILIALGVWVAWRQLERMNAQNKADFTYKVYQDLLRWLEKHKECRDWIFKLEGKLGDNFDKWEFNDFLGYFEALYSLKKRGLVDEEIVYDLLSD
ncbi:MAG: hypothetical protein QXD43_05545, partial [Candidatus Aenigmatarchaeota archaeon]